MSDKPNKPRNFISASSAKDLRAACGITQAAKGTNKALNDEVLEPSALDHCTVASVNAVLDGRKTNSKVDARFARLHLGEIPRSTVGN